jgi:hypothetical protein
MAITTRSRFWGPLFPDVWDTGVTFWGPLFPDPGPALELVTPIGPAGVATFVLDLDAQLTMTLEYETDVFKADEGKETRAEVLDFPRRRIKGSALLIGGASVRRLRTQLQRWAAEGATFLLGLPFESLLLAADAAGTTLTVNVGALAKCDWANPGQRVVVVGKNRTATNAVVQSATGTSIVLDVAPGAIGAAGGSVMPTVPIFLQPQQGFSRYVPPDGIERWSIDAIVNSFGWQTQAVAAQLAGVDTGASGNFDEVIFQAMTPGIGGNDIRIEMADDSLAGVDYTEVGNDITIRFIPDVSTMGDLAAAIAASSSLIRMIGSWDPSNTLSSIDVFSLMSLAGGSDGDYATEGTGAVVATHAGRPVFDRGLVVDDTAADTLQAMNEIVGFGGLQENIGRATTPDWGRQVALEAKIGAEWQWLKRFLATVHGPQKTFWLPAWRCDLVPVSSGVNTLTIENPTEDSGGFTTGAPADFFTWYATRQDIQIRQADGTITRATITNAVDNGDGTITLTIGTTLSGSPIDMVSWLEACRFENNAIDVAFVNHLFSMTTTARAVQR